MDHNQTDHLKAYGITFNALVSGGKADWLLNYKGGSFLLNYNDKIAAECRLEGVAFNEVSFSESAEIYAFVQSDENNMDVIRLEKAPKIAVYVPPNVTISAFVGGSGFYRGGVPAFWLARSHLDPEPPAALRHRLAHYFLPNCASFKVEWTPNDIRLEQAGLPEVVWIDPFKEPADDWPAAVVGPRNAITAAGVTKPRHLDEFAFHSERTS